MFSSFNQTLPVQLLPPLTGDNNIDTRNLQIFLESLYHPRTGTSFYIQLYVCGGIVAFLLPVGGIMILHRFMKGRAWFFKLWQVAGGTFVIPNSVVAFIAFQGCFGIIWLAYAWVTIKHYQNRSFHGSYFLWMILTWIPLWDGGWFTAFGMFSAFPDALTRKTKISKQKRLILSPSAFNCICWGVPVLHACSLLPLAILAARKNDAASMRFDAWGFEVASALSTKLSDEAAASLRARAMQLWLDLTKVYWYASINMSCWTAWAAVMLIVHLPVGAHTLIRVRKALVISRSNLQAAAGRPMAILPNDSGEKLALKSQHVEPRGDTIGATSSRVFPSLREEPTTPQSASSSKYQTAEQRRLRSLRRIFKNLTVQYLGISVAILGFMIASGVDALKLYGAARTNEIAHCDMMAHLFASWSIVLFGSLVAFCIVQRSFDPSLSIDVPDEEASRITYSTRSVRTVKAFFSPRCAGPSGRAGKNEPTSRSQCQGFRKGGAMCLSGSTTHGAKGATSSEKRHGSVVEEDMHGPTGSTGSLSTKRGSDLRLTDPAHIHFATPFGTVPLLAPEAPRKVFVRSSLTSTQLLEHQALEYISRDDSASDLLMHKPSVSSLSFGQQSGKISRRSSLSADFSSVSSHPPHMNIQSTAFVSISPSRPRTASSSVKRDQVAARRTSSYVRHASSTPSLPLLDMDAKCFLPHPARVELKTCHDHDIENPPGAARGEMQRGLAPPPVTPSRRSVSAAVREPSSKTDLV